MLQTLLVTEICFDIHVDTKSIVDSHSAAVYWTIIYGLDFKWKDFVDISTGIHLYLFDALCSPKLQFWSNVFIYDYTSVTGDCYRTHTFSFPTPHIYINSKCSNDASTKRMFKNHTIVWTCIYSILNRLIKDNTSSVNKWITPGAGISYN